MGWVKRTPHSARLSTSSRCSSIASQKRTQILLLCSSLPLGCANPSEVGGPRRAFVAESRGLREGSTDTQNCWFPRSS